DQVVIGVEPLLRVCVGGESQLDYQSCSALASVGRISVVSLSSSPSGYPSSRAASSNAVKLSTVSCGGAPGVRLHARHAQIVIIVSGCASMSPLMPSLGANRSA